jgi:hypothetical protein
VEACGYFGMSPVGNGVRMVTLLDRTEEWLASQRLPADVARRVQAAADLRIKQWHEAQDQRLTAMRSAELHTLRYQASLLQRCSGAITFALVSKHATLSIFLAPFLDAIQRWQSFVALISGILAVLVVNIWCASAVHFAAGAHWWVVACLTAPSRRMLYSQSLNCCREARAFLGCSTLTAEPCHGFTGDCASLLTVFAAVAFDGAPGVPTGYTCEQFPVAGSYHDSLILGLLSWACSLPVTLFVLNCFCARTLLRASLRKLCAELATPPPPKQGAPTRPITTVHGCVGTSHGGCCSGALIGATRRVMQAPQCAQRT